MSDRPQWRQHYELAFQFLSFHLIVASPVISLQLRVTFYLRTFNLCVIGTNQFRLKDLDKWECLSVKESVLGQIAAQEKVESCTI